MSTPTVIPATDWRARLRSSRGGQLLVLLVTAAVLAGGWWLVKFSSSTEQQGAAATSVQLTGDQSGEGPVVGKQAPDFTATALDGSKVSLSGLKGKPVWLSFGATWCTACRAEAPDVQATHVAKPGLAVIDVYVGEDDATVKEYTQRLGLGYTHLVDPRTELGSTYRAVGLPTHVFIDADGIVRKVVVGGVTKATISESLATIGV